MLVILDEADAMTYDAQFKIGLFEELNLTRRLLTDNYTAGL